MSTTRMTTSRLGLAAVALTLGLGCLTACGDDGGDHPSTDAAASGQQDHGTGEASAGGTKSGADGKAGSGKGAGASGSSKGSGKGSGTGSGKGSGKGNGKGQGGSSGGSGGTSSGGKGGSGAKSPFVVAAAAAGSRSLDTVATLHAMGVATTNETGIPHRLLPDQGKSLRAALQDEVVAASRLTPPKNSPAARLVGSLNVYRDAAGQLAQWSPDSGPLPDEWFSRLKAADVTWLRALRELSDASGQDLLKVMPSLIMPGI